MVNFSNILILLISLFACAVTTASVAERLQKYPRFVGQNYLGGMTPLIQENSILDYRQQDLQWMAEIPFEKLYQYQNQGWISGRRK